MKAYNRIHAPILSSLLRRKVKRLQWSAMLVLSLFLFSVQLQGQTYCAAAAGTIDEYISNVEVGTINNPSGASLYTDYTALSTNMTVGLAYPITVTVGDAYSSDRVRIWIDWDQNFQFDDDPIVVTPTSGYGPFTAVITPPAGSVTGPTRMRIGLRWSSDPVPCGTSQGYGEFEDYTINVQLPAPNDAGIAAIVSPTSPAMPSNQPVVVKLQNFGGNNLNQVTIHWSVNGNPGTPVNWIGPSLAPGASADVVVGNATFNLGDNPVQAYTTSPNQNIDPNTTNDTADAMVNACNFLNGVYTVGPGGDYATILDAFAAMYGCGVGGPVVFNFLPGAGPITGGLEITPIAGASAINTITFNGNGTEINQSTASYILAFNGAKHMVINDFQFINTTPTTNKFGIMIRGGSDYLSFTNNYIDVGTTSTSTSTAGIVLSNSTTSATSSGTNGNNITISGNEIVGGYYGISMYGSASYTGNEGNVIANNIIRDFYQNGIRLYNADDVVITGNNIHRSNRTSLSTLYGIYAYYVKNVKIRKNQVHSPGVGTYSAYPIYLGYSVNVAGAETELINNAVYNITTTGLIYGIYLLSTRDYVNIYFNTVYLETEGTSTKYGIYMSGAPNNHKMKNNISSVQGTGTGTKYCIYVSTTSTSFVSDNNNFHMGATGGTNNNIGYWGGVQGTLEDWQLATAQDVHSISIDPMFQTPTNITPQLLNNKGVPIPGITTDIFGTTRSASTPDIGAVEFNAPANPIMLLSKTSHDFGFVEAGQTYSFPLTIMNGGGVQLAILNKTVGSPFSIVTVPPTGIIFIPANGSLTVTVRYSPTSAGEHMSTLQFTTNATVFNFSVALQGKAYPPGSMIEDFEGAIFPPYGWTLVQGPCYNPPGTTTNEITRSTTKSVSPVNSLRFSSYSSCAAGYDQYLVSPKFSTTPGNQTYSFWYSRNSTTGAMSIQLGWSSTGNDVNTDFTWDTVYNLPLSTAWAQYEKTNLPVGTKYVAIKYTGPTIKYLYIDDIFGPPLDLDPYGLTAYRIDADQTVVAGLPQNYKAVIKNEGNNADVFNLNTTSAKGFTYTIRNKQDNATISSLALAAGAQDTVILKVSVSGAGGTTIGDKDTALLQITSQGDGTISQSLSFTTTAIIPFTPPYVQDFTNYGTGPFEFWEEAKGLIANPTVFTSTTSSQWTSDDFGNDLAHPFGKSARMEIWSTGRYEWLISPVFDLGAKSIYKLEFDLALTYWSTTAADVLSNDDTLALVISTDGGATWLKSNIIQVWDANTPISNTGDHIVIDLTPYSGIVRFGFYAFSNVSGGDVNVYVDNFTLIDPTALPECVTSMQPADLTTDVETTVSLSWAPTANTTGYKVYFGTTDPPPFASNVGNALEYDPGVLNYNTDYYWQVVPYNLAGDAVGCPVWTFKTLSPITPPYLQDFEQAFPPQFWAVGHGLIENPTTLELGTSDWYTKSFGNVSGHVNGTAPIVNLWTEEQYEWLFSPLFDVSGASQIFVEFDLIMTQYNQTTTGTMDGNDTLALVISTDGGATWNKSNILALWDSLNPIPDTLVRISLSLTGYTGIVQFGFYAQSDGPDLSANDVDIFIDNFAVLAPGILGFVNYANAANTPLENVNVQIPAQAKSTMTDASGLFGFMPMANGTFNLLASSMETTGGVNSTDALLVMRHFVGLNPLTGLAAIAADVTGASGINTGDALEIQKFYIKMVTGFPVGPWVFTPATVSVAGDVPVVMIQGLVTGDVNASFLPGAKAEPVVALYHNEELLIPANREVEIPVFAAQTMELGAISLTLDYPANRLRIDAVTTSFPAENLLWKAENGKLVITWFSLHGMTAPTGSEIFSIHAVATAGSDAINFHGSHGEFATSQGLVIENAAISIPKLVTTSNHEGLMLSTYPNPTHGVSTFTYEVVKAGNVRLELFNALGEKVASLVNSVHDAGIYQMSFDGTHLPAGVYISKLDVNGQSASVRLIITE